MNMDCGFFPIVRDGLVDRRERSLPLLDGRESGAIGTSRHYPILRLKLPPTPCATNGFPRRSERVRVFGLRRHDTRASQSPTRAEPLPDCWDRMRIPTPRRIGS